MEIDVDIIVNVPEGVDADQFSDELMEWMESKGYTFGGRIGPYQEEPE